MSKPGPLPAPKKAAPAEFSLSNSEKRTFTTCRKKWYWQYAKKYSPMATPTPFLVGTAIHKVLETFYKGQAALDEPAINDIVNGVFDPVAKGQGNMFLDPDQLEDLEKQRTMTQGMGLAYMKVYADDLKKWEVLELEKEGHWRIAPKWDMYFTVDMIVRVKKTKEIAIVEHKTTAAIDHNYVARLSLDDQVSTYLVGTERAWGIKPDRVIYNVMMKPRIRPKQTETREQYLERVMALYVESPQEYLFRADLMASDRDLEQFEKELGLFTQEMERAASLQFYYKNTDACSVRGTCPNMPLCVEGEDQAADRFKVRDHKSQYGADADSD